MSRVVVVLASQPKSCEVCNGAEQMAISVPGVRIAQPVPCLHCRIGVRVVRVPMRREEVRP